MKLEQIITIVLSSSLISSLLTVFFQWVFKFIDYKNDFNKKIIDKRITAYEGVENIIWNLSLKSNDGKRMWPLFCTNEDLFNEFVVNIAFLNRNTIWLSNNLGRKLTELNAFVIRLHNDNKPVTESDYIKIGCNNMKEINSYRKTIETMFKKDFKNLHSVRKFFREKDKSNEKYPLLTEKNNDY